MELEKTLESPLDCKEIQPVHPKGDRSWVFIGRTGAEAETPVLWPLHVKSWLIGKDPDAGRDWGQEEKETTEDEMASLTRWAWVWVNSGSWWWTGRPGMLQFIHGVAKSRTRLSDWTEASLFTGWLKGELHLQTGGKPGQRGDKAEILKNLPQWYKQLFPVQKDYNFIYNIHVTESYNFAAREQNLHL